MQIHCVNAERKLAGVVTSIGRSPKSWRNWMVLQLDVSSDVEGAQTHESLFWIETVLSSYLNQKECVAFFCNEHSAHIFCKGISREVFQHAADHICSLLSDESGFKADYKIFDVYDTGFSYVRNIYDRLDEILKIPMAALGENILEELHKTHDQFYFEKEGEQDEKVQGAGAKVLLVEDDPVTRWMVKSTLKDECDLVMAPTAHQAFSKVQAFNPDVVFLDIDLPDQSGKEVLSWIMRNDPGMSVVMFSSHNSPDIIADTLSEGACGFVSKPFLKSDLMDYIRMHA